MPRPRPVAERLWEKVDASTGPWECWPFTGATSRGYGLLSRPGGGSPLKAHRVAYEMAFGPILGQVNHHCDNPPCCNPFHLYDGTPKDNARDAVVRGRLNNTRTHCKRGHAFTPENTRWQGGGSRRRCLICYRAYYAAKREAA